MLSIIAILGALLVANDGANPIPFGSPQDCAQVAAYYRAEVVPWLGSQWAMPPDTRWFDRVEFDDQGGRFVWRSDSMPRVEFVYHLFTMTMTPPAASGGYPRTWGYHDGCMVARKVHPLRWAFGEAREQIRDGYQRAALPCLLKRCWLRRW